MDDQIYALTEEGYTQLLALMGEFCRGFTIEEIAKNSERTEDEIKIMLLTLFEGYAEAYNIWI